MLFATPGPPFGVRMQTNHTGHTDSAESAKMATIDAVRRMAVRLGAS